MGPSRRAALLVGLLAVSAACLPRAAAVVCQSYRSAADCNGRVTSSGECVWDSASRTCVVGAALPPGRVAVTSIDEPSFAMTSSEPVPTAEAPGRTRGLLQTPVSVCVDRPTPEGFTCEQQRSWGKCTEPWMAEGGFCRRTCNLCDVQPTGADVQPPADTSSEGQPDIVESVEGRGVVPGAEGPSDSQFCDQPAVQGPCRAAQRSWYFDAAAGDCKPFLYGGCQGNSNRFPTFDDCAAAASLFCGAAL